MQIHHHILRYVSVILLSLGSASVARSEFVLSLDPSTLTYNGPGVVDVPVYLTQVGGGATTISGFSFQLRAPNADGQPSGFDSDIVTGATEGLQVGQLQGAFRFNNDVNTVSASDFTFANAADVGAGNRVALFNVQLTVGNQASYTVDFDFQNAQRGFVDIGNEFSIGSGFDSPSAGPSGVGFDSTFTVTSVTAIPEPTSLAFLAVMGAFVTHRRRRRL